MPLKAITANFACASPSEVASERRAATDRSAQTFAQEGIDLIFAQEMPTDNEWIDMWREARYDLQYTSTYKVRSAMIWRHGLDVQPVDLATAPYHGSYLAAARLDMSDFRDDVLLVSVHASPTADLDKYLDAWGPENERPTPRTGAGPDAGRLFDSDLVLETLRRAARTQQVIAAGDYNECRKWDDTHPGNWGGDYFERVAKAGLTSVTWDQWAEERRTSFGPAGDKYQLDHILATPKIADRIANPRVAKWDERTVARGELSDHAPISFEIY